MRVVLLSHHWYPSPRRAGFHHLAGALAALGHQVTFATTGLSWLSYLRRDYRTRYKGIWAARNVMQQVGPRLHSYVHFTAWHPHTLLLPLLDRLTSPLMGKYTWMPLGSLQATAAQADVFIFESNPGLYLLPKMKSLNPKAKLVYRVSDDMAMLRSTHPALLAFEQAIAPDFDLVSLPTIRLMSKFSGLANCLVQAHAIDKKAFDEVKRNPYQEGSANCVFVGNSHFDKDFLYHASQSCPAVNFHIIGPIAPFIKRANIFWYGEMPFKQTLPYIKFANVGMQTRSGDLNFIPLLKDSLKVIQYRYCGLPIVAPASINLERQGVYYYRPDNSVSCKLAVEQALTAGRDLARGDEVQSWEELAQSMLAAVDQGLG